MFKKLFRKKSVSQIMADLKAGELADAVHPSLNKTLGVRDLTSFGIAAIVGAGIFSTIGSAAVSGGPAVVFLFLFTAFACGLSALSYAEFASMAPVSGSAYTYTYISFGELMAWIIGWDLLFEYAIGNIAVAISWSDYFTGFLSGLNIHVPEYLSMDYLSASRGFKEASAILANGGTMESLGTVLQEKYLAWVQAPMIGNLKIIADIPALMITVLITYLVYVGIKESRTAANLMVVLKLLVVIAVILIGFFYVNPMNWSPFAPNGVSGVLKGISAVFFAYIGFDAISTTAEECKDPQRDLPKAMIYSLIICTVLYVLIALVLTGVVPYSTLGVGDPLSFAFKSIGLNWFSGIIAFSAIIAISSVLLVYQMGQPRIWMSMSRDGLLPKIFARIHPKFKTPSFSTIVAGFVVAVPALFMNLTEVTDLTSIGTLFAFILVNAGVLIMSTRKEKPQSKFKTPYVNAKYILPLSLIAIAIYIFLYEPSIVNFFFSQTDAAHPELGFWDVFKHKIPFYLFLILTLFIGVAAYLKNLSLIPCVGLLSCSYLITELGIVNWSRFLIWLLAGLIIYFIYGFKHSKLGLEGK